MPFTTPMRHDAEFMQLAQELALSSWKTDGGLPIGAVLVGRRRKILGRGHNMRVQSGNPILHGEMACLANAGPLETYEGCTLYTTLSPCMMCAGTILQFGIARVVVGDAVNYVGTSGFLAAVGVSVTLLDDPRCKRMMAAFIKENPKLWLADVAGKP